MLKSKGIGPPPLCLHSHPWLENDQINLKISPLIHFSGNNKPIQLD
uniref:Uncharacterized protein n=1 Tax=Nelumbo nucifera TaxID=4432 RepID=A0A822YM21_NELNU|nr:TPA_asm: hypothetical protein HUJ06_011482 [Nelumbo nucifera]